MSIWKSRPAASRPPAPRLEIIARLPAKPRRAPPLVFVHGAWHGAWCWEDHFLGYFAERGFACYALNLRGHGVSLGARDVRFCRIRHFVEDVAEAVEQIGARPILIGHSLGGFIVQKYLETHEAELAVLLASVPPRGGRRMVKRVQKALPLAMLHSNLVFSLKPLFANAARVRSLLFTEATPEFAVEACRARLQDDVILGLLDYLFLDLVDPAKVTTDMLVFGAAQDRMIDAADLEATARAYGRRPLVIPALGHNMMVDAGWELAAAAVARGILQHLGAEAIAEARISDVA